MISQFVLTLRYLGGGGGVEHPPKVFFLIFSEFFVKKYGKLGEFLKIYYGTVAENRMCVSIRHFEILTVSQPKFFQNKAKSAIFLRKS